MSHLGGFNMADGAAASEAPLDGEVAMGGVRDDGEVSEAAALNVLPAWLSSLRPFMPQVGVVGVLWVCSGC